MTLGGGAPLCTSADAVRGLLDPDLPAGPAARHRDEPPPDQPGLPPVLPALRWGYGHVRVVTGASIAVLLIAVVNLMHFSQGWVQFGYRFANDFAPWALLLVALGLERVVHWAGGPRSWPITAWLDGRRLDRVDRRLGVRQLLGRRLGRRARLVSSVTSGSTVGAAAGPRPPRPARARPSGRRRATAASCSSGSPRSASACSRWGLRCGG